MNLVDRKGFGIATLALVAALCGPAFAGEDCCKGGAAAAEKAAGHCDEAAKKAGGCEAAKAPAHCEEAAKAPASCGAGKDAASCDDKLAKQTEAALAGLGAPAQVADEKAADAAKRELASVCPLGSKMTHSFASIVEGLQAVRALDAAMMAGGKDLPADCKTPEGGCAFCAEAGGKMTDAARGAKMAGMKALARAEKLGAALAAKVATFGGPAPKAVTGVPTAADYEKIAAALDALAADIKAACEKAKALPAAEMAKIEAAAANLEKAAPGAMDAMMAGMKAFYCEIAFAAHADGECLKAVDEKLVAGLSTNAKNAYNLGLARGKVMASLAKIAEATGSCAGGECGTAAKPAAAAEKKDDCCGGKS